MARFGKRDNLVTKIEQGQGLPAETFFQVLRMVTTLGREQWLESHPVSLKKEWGGIVDDDPTLIRLCQRAGRANKWQDIEITSYIDPGSMCPR